MATILLGAAGAFVGGGFGGTVLGLSGAVIGRAVGATLGRAIDQRLLGAGSEPVAVGRLDRLRIMGAGQGAALPVVWGKMRVGGQVIWASGFTELAVQSGGGGGKGAPRQTVTSYSYSVSLAVALCEGVIAGVGRVWADGTEVDPQRLGMRVYTGSETQLPDPKIAAVLGEGAPAYRGTAYAVFEDLALADFGNRVPQFSFEVIRAAQGDVARSVPPFAEAIRAVALIPGTGEYALALRPVRMGSGFFAGPAVNQHSAAGGTDLAVSLRQLRGELPNCGSVSLVVTWFGDDLRCGQCRVQPKVEQTAQDGWEMPWRAGGIGRGAAVEVPRVAGRSIYGGTPADQAVIEAIRAIREGGQEVMFYPFVLMDQVAGNNLPDPYQAAIGQPVLPWRGRITLSTAPGRIGSPDRSAAAEAEVAAFFGQVQPGHFAVSGEAVSYFGPPQDWGFRRFILHYAHLCAAAGGVDAFCIGSELRGLTEIRGEGDSFPAVMALRQLAQEVRAILGPEVKISYAADWSEYSGFARDGNRYFHLDALWSDPAVDFIGIDNYLPLTDWRQAEDQADAALGAPHDLRHLQAGIEGGEGYDWYYASVEGEQAQRREPITDGAGEPWIWRVKDMRNWWSQPHHPRMGGERLAQSTDWVPMSKPIRFTEYGCAAVDRGSNQPNLFLDRLSSESALPRASTGQRDDLIQMQYYRAVTSYWSMPGMNPISPLYQGPMIDMDRAHAWAWDARPFPAFPLREDVWADGPNHARGHWLNGRATAQPVDAVAGEICARAGISQVDLAGVHGIVRGYALGETATARAALQPLMLAAGFDAAEQEGVLSFRSRSARVDRALEVERLVASEKDPVLEVQRMAEDEATACLRISALDAGGDLQRAVVEARRDGAGGQVSDQDVPLALLPEEAQRLADRWLSELRVGRETARFALPLSSLPLTVGEVALLNGQRWRIDRVEQGAALAVEAVQVEPGVYLPGPDGAQVSTAAAFSPSGPVIPLFLDLPLIRGQEEPHAPHLAVTAQPWPGRVAVWSSDEAGAGFELDSVLTSRAVIGQTQSAMAAARVGVWDRSAALPVRFVSGTVAAAAERAVLNGANLAAIGDGSRDGWEVFQFATAEMIGPGEWALGQRLRGLFGTDAGMPDAWPAGSHVVLLNAAVTQIDLSAAQRGLERVWRIGPAARGFDHPEAVERKDRFDGIGLRPYSVVHLRKVPVPGGTEIRWIRRTRIDGDSWTAPEVPLGEEREAYLVRIIRDGVTLRSLEVTAPVCFYSDAERLADGAVGITLSVAQLSARYGAGPFRDLVL